MKIIKNIALFAALSMPFAASAWEWTDVRKKAAKTCQGLCDVAIGGTFAALAWPTLKHSDLLSRLSDYSYKTYLLDILPLGIEGSNTEFRPHTIKQIESICSTIKDLAKDMTFSRNIAVGCAVAAIALKLGSYFLKPTEVQQENNANKQI